MRPRAVGGLEPDDAEQRDLVDLWHLSRTVLAGTSPTRTSRIDWVVNEFCLAYPDVARKWAYVWCERYLGRLVDPDPVPEPPDGWPDGPTTSGHASFMPSSPRGVRSKKRAKIR